MASRSRTTAWRDRPAPHLFFGVLFGYFLSKSSATDYDTIVDMFLLKEFHLYGVIGTAIAVVALGLFLLRKAGRPTITREPFEAEPLSFQPRRLR